MKTLSKDARGFIDGVAQYVSRSKRGKSMLPKMQSLFTKVTAAAKKERVATVTSVVALSESEKSTIKRVLAEILEHDVECHFFQDPDILGGVKIKVADWVVDTSVATQLTNLTHTLV